MANPNRESMKVELFDYELPVELIAQEPVEPRDSSRLLVLHRASGVIEHRLFRDLPDYLEAGDTLVVNDTRVSAWRLHGQKPTGGHVEALLLRQLDTRRWLALVRPGRRLPLGISIHFGDLEAKVIERREDGLRVLEFGEGVDWHHILPQIGRVPLPPYIHSELADPERYQTVYAAQPGSAAAPTAGLHFTPELLERLQAQGIRIAKVTLHVSLDTFRPVKTDRIEEHEMKGERFTLSEEAAEMINNTPGRIIAAGTTTVRTLESAAVQTGRVRALQGETYLYITPGYPFRVVQGMITNFHLPRTTMLVLVCAFAGRERVLRAYQEAIRERYRFLSFGDAMLIL